MKDRIAGAPGQYSAVVTGGEYQKLQSGRPFSITLTRDDRPKVEGTPYSKAAVLPDDVARRLCPGLGDPTPADAFDSLEKNKAPAGYGWGEAAGFNPPYADPDNVSKTCVFTASQGNIPAGGIWRGVAYFQTPEAGQMTIRADFNGVEVAAKRYKIDGVWQPWEWVSPLLTPGIEYRTTERYNGKAVYTKLVDCGAMPNNAEKRVMGAVPSGATVISGDAMAWKYNSDGSPVAAPIAQCGNGDSWWVDGGGTYIGILTTKDMSGYNAKVLLKYTKRGE